AQIEQGKAEWRMHERGLHVDAEQNAEPDEIDAELLRHRPEQRHDDEGELEEIKKEGEHEAQEIGDDEEAELTARQAEQEMLDPEIAVDAAENKTEDRRADEDEDDEGRQLRRRVHRLAQQLPI